MFKGKQTEALKFQTGLHVTSPRPCWWSRTKEPFSFGNETPISWKFCEKKFYWIDQPAWPPCHVVANQNKYFNFIWTLQMLYCHFFGISLMKVLLLCSQEVVKGPDLNEGALWKKIFSALWSSVILWWWWWWWCGRGGGRWLFGKAWSLGHYPRNKVVEIDLAVPFFPAYSFISICGIIIASMVVSRGIL